MMDFRRLRTFVTVAEQGSVSRAAVCLHISQPSLSRQLQELQRELGLRLFDRIGRRLVLTVEGEQMLGNCRSLLGHASSLSEQANLLSHGATGVLRVAATPSQIETVLLPFLPRFAERYPGVQVMLIESVGADKMGMLERGEIHLSISLLEAVANEDRHFGTYPVAPLEVLAACHPSFPLDEGSTVDICSLASHPLLLPDSGFVLRKMFDAACRLAAFKPSIAIECRAPHTLLALAEAGRGIAIISSTIQTHRHALRTIQMTHKGKPIRYPRAIVWDKRRGLPRYAQDFCKSLAAHMRKQLPVAPPPRVQADSRPKMALTHPKKSRTRIRRKMVSGIISDRT